MNSILLLVTYTAKPGMREDFLRDVQGSGILPVIRSEAGCLRYAYFLDADDPDQSAERQQVHLTQPHMKRLLEIKTRCIAETSVEKIAVTDRSL